MQRTTRPPRITPSDKHKLADLITVVIVAAVVMVLVFACMDIGSR